MSLKFKAGDKVRIGITYGDGKNTYTQATTLKDKTPDYYVDGVVLSADTHGEFKYPYYVQWFDNGMQWTDTACEKHLEHLKE